MKMSEDENEVRDKSEVYLRNKNYKGIFKASIYKPDDKPQELSIDKDSEADTK